MTEARESDIANARKHGVAIIRADVAGRAGRLMSHGSSAIVDRGGQVLAAAPPWHTDLLMSKIGNR